MRCFLLFIISLLTTISGITYAQTGITTDIKNTKYICIGKAEKYMPFIDNLNKIRNADKFIGMKNQRSDILLEPGWKLVDTFSIQSYVPAGANIGVKLNIPRRKLEPVNPLNLCQEATAAVKKAPEWIRLQLANTLARLSVIKQKIFAGIINDAEDPYIDEIAFTIAYESSEFLASNYCYPQVFVDNAKLIYNHDSDLAYVDIVNYGNSAIDENYYSTVKYWKIDKDSNKVSIEVPKEIYYMYLVHPKTSDEYETYVDPKVVETFDNSDHHWNIKPPPDGVFWRDFLYTHTEQNLNDTTGAHYPILRDSIMNCTVLWDETNREKQAVRTITQWVKSVMNFTSKTERPHQPNRIYALHIGRCGEHEDLTNAAARSCLIPSRGIEAFSSDHVWNEFWDEQWWQWEPVNVSHKDPLVYEKGWGKKFGSLMARRSDGAIESVTGTYSEHPCIISVVALDSKSRPVDGAVVLLAVKGTLDDASIFIDNYGITDNNGLCTFTISSDRIYFARVISSIGNYPAADNQVVQLVENPAMGSINTYQLKLSGTKPTIIPDTIAVPPIGTDEFHLLVNAQVIGQSKKWDILFNDLGGSHTFYDGSGGTIDFLMADEDNFNQGSGISTYSVFNSAKDLSDYSKEIAVPNDGKVYYAWLKNLNCMNNYVIVSASFALYAEPSVSVEENTAGNIQSSGYPNPFDKTVTVSFNQKETGIASVVIYNTHGMAVRNLSNQLFNAGEQSFVWDATDNYGKPLDQGVYFCIIRSGSDMSCIKLEFIK